MTEEQNKSSIPLPEDFFIRTPLYETILFDSEQDFDALFAIKYFKKPLDSYCPLCNNHSIFHNSSGGTNYDKQQFSVNHIFSVEMVCSRDKNHTLFYIIQVLDSTIQKIGQYPSTADLQLQDLAKYRQILGAERYRELTRGVGLSAHGVGIGAFVYLRRIFESLVEEASKLAEKENRLNQSKYTKARVVERIKMLKNYLPRFLVENAKLYGILSKGMHELNEDECLKYFPVVKSGIELILDEKLERQKQQEKTKAASKAIEDAGFEIENK